MQGLMMDMPLLISGLLQHADRHHADAEIVSKMVDASVHRYTYRDAHARARKLAAALQRLGVQPGERIATLAWNSYRHFEIYYAVAGSGAVIHTINPRLFPEQIGYIANHAEDKYVFFDLSFAPLLEKLAPLLKTVKAYVAMCAPEAMPKANLPSLLCSRICSGKRKTISGGPRSTSVLQPACATHRAPPETRRAPSTATARRCCTHSAPRCPTA